MFRYWEIENDPAKETRKEYPQRQMHKKDIVVSQKSSFNSECYGLNCISPAPTPPKHMYALISNVTVFGVRGP